MSTHEAEWTPFQTHCLSENPEAPGIEPRTSGSVARNSDHDPGARCGESKSPDNKITTKYVG
jgi:hypothetical protein